MATTKIMTGGIKVRRKKSSEKMEKEEISLASTTKNDDIEIVMLMKSSLPFYKLISASLASEQVLDESSAIQYAITVPIDHHYRDWLCLSR